MFSFSVGVFSELFQSSAEQQLAFSGFRAMFSLQLVIGVSFLLSSQSKLSQAEPLRAAERRHFLLSFLLSFSGSVYSPVLKTFLSLSKAS